MDAGGVIRHPVRVRVADCFPVALHSQDHGLNKAQALGRALQIIIYSFECWIFIACVRKLRNSDRGVSPGQRSNPPEPGTCVDPLLQAWICSCHFPFLFVYGVIMISESRGGLWGKVLQWILLKCSATYANSYSFTATIFQAEPRRPITCEWC